VTLQPAIVRLPSTVECPAKFLQSNRPPNRSTVEAGCIPFNMKGKL
jgi:hypothetical protein